MPRMFAVMPQKEMSMAFEPTPNDVLYASVQQHNGHHANHTNASQTNGGIGGDYLSAISSPTPNSVAVSSSQQSSASTPLYACGLPERTSVTSASDIPPGNGGALRSPFDQHFWFNLYNEVVESRRRDQELWTRERAGLRREIEHLREQLAKIPNAVDANAALTAEKFAFGASMVQHATEKLRQFSVISPPSTRRSSGEPADVSETVAARRASSQVRAASTSNQLQTINEDNPPERPVHVTIIPEMAVVDDDEDLRNVPGDIEDPFSPPPTGRLSPPPAAYTKHAGHTPLVARSNRPSISEIDEESRQNALQNAQLLDPANGHFDADGLDEDPELIGEKILPLTPEGASKKGMMMLNELDTKLSQVAEDPEKHTPTVVQVADLQEASEARYAKAQPSDTISGVPLRAKRSTNFGAPLGQLRRNS